MFKALPLVILPWTTFAQTGQFEPPLGQKWGSSSSDLLPWAQERKLDISIFIPAQQPLTRKFTLTKTKISPQGIIYPKVEFGFFDDKLVEVTLWHATADMSSADVQNYCRQVRRELSTRFSLPWRPNKHQSSERDGIRVESSSWHMEPVPGLIINMALTEVHDPLRETRKSNFTLTFVNQNLINKIR